MSRNRFPVSRTLISTPPANGSFVSSSTMLASPLTRSVENILLKFSWSASNVLIKSSFFLLSIWFIMTSTSSLSLRSVSFFSCS